MQSIRFHLWISVGCQCCALLPLAREGGHGSDEAGISTSRSLCQTPPSPASGRGAMERGLGGNQIAFLCTTLILLRRDLDRNRHKQCTRISCVVIQAYRYRMRILGG